MNYKQEQNLKQLDFETLIVGVDVSKDFHVARSEDLIGFELGKSIKFDNDLKGYEEFVEWFKEIMEKEKKTKVIIGMEPTGVYWLPLARWLKVNDYKAVTVNPAATKKSKELDDNNQSKTDYRDARVIANLVKEGRYTEPNLLEGIYEELRNANNLRRAITKDVVCKKNQMINWLDRYFPEYKNCCNDWESVTFMWMLKRYKLPSVIASQDPEEVFQEIHKEHKYGIGRTMIKKIIEYAKKSVGITEGLSSACLELDYYIKQYESIKSELAGIEARMNELLSQSEDVKRIMEIDGIGLVLAVGIVSELGDIRKYTSPKQMSKMTGLSLIEDSSGKKKGQMIISKRGRSKLRHIMYQAVFSMLKNNKELYEYYTKRNIHPLKGKEAMVALMNKLLRIIHTLIVKDVHYDANKMMSDVRHPENMVVVAQ
ncbi:MAG: IS110 family transposase [Erysipelotrichaceae bacterium]|nr:IS110 family transposase [Erysipelotrichaceae bacterium]